MHDPLAQRLRRSAFWLTAGDGAWLSLAGDDRAVFDPLPWIEVGYLERLGAGLGGVEALATTAFAYQEVEEAVSDVASLQWRLGDASPHAAFVALPAACRGIRLQGATLGGERGATLALRGFALPAFAYAGFAGEAEFGVGRLTAAGRSACAVVKPTTLLLDVDAAAEEVEAALLTTGGEVPLWHGALAEVAAVLAEVATP
jgi:hypothetical protein